MNERKRGEFVSKLEEDVIIPNHGLVEVTKMNNVTELRYLTNRNNSIAIKKINADEYIKLETGEIRKFQKGTNRTDNTNSLLRTFRKLRMLINANFEGAQNEAMLTLTYKENMRDFHQLGHDFSVFNLRMKRLFPDIEYIRVAEPQGRGAWHLHVLVKISKDERFYLSNEKLAQVWGHGFTFIKRLKDVDNVGSYVSAYLTDIPVDSEDELTEGTPKKVIKGGRLHLYPTGMRLYTKSKGIVEPQSFFTEYGKIKNTNLGKLVFKNSKIVKDDSGKIVTRIKTLQFNSKRF